MWVCPIHMSRSTLHYSLWPLTTFFQELEMELLRATNRMAALATDHAQQMEALTDQTNNLKVGGGTAVCLTWYHSKNTF